MQNENADMRAWPEILSRGAVRQFARIVPLVLLLGCTRPAARSGYVVTSRVSAEHALRPGDTLREGLLDTFPRAILRTVAGLETSRVDPHCLRIFARDTIVFIYLPGFCGREPTGDDYSLGGITALLNRSGAVLDSTGAGWIVATLCPGERGPDGALYTGGYWRLDGCQHRRGEVVESLLASGTDTRWGVIMPHAVTRGLLDQCSRDVPRRADFEWTPSVEQIDRLEGLLGPYLLQSNQALPVPLKRYWRQYGGFGVGQDSLIYVSLGASPDTASVRPNTIVPEVVCDGGDYYFGIIFNPRTGEFSHLAFNGEA